MVSTHLKNMLVQLDHLPRDRGKNIKYEWNRHLEDYHLAIPCKTAILFRRVSFSFQVPPIAHLREYVEKSNQNGTYRGEMSAQLPLFFWPFLGAEPQLPMSLLLKNNELGSKRASTFGCWWSIRRKPYSLEDERLEPTAITHEKKGKWSAKPPGKYVPAVNLHVCTFIISIPCISWIWL